MGSTQIKGVVSVSATYYTTQGFDFIEDPEADGRRAELAASEGEISSIRARQTELVRRADELQLDTADGARTLADWVRASLDVSPQTAGRLARIAQHHQPDIGARMASGEGGLDRANFLCQIRELNGPEDVVADSDSFSLGHLFGLIDRLCRIDTLSEQLDFEQRYMVIAGAGIGFNLTTHGDAPTVGTTILTTWSVSVGITTTSRST